MVRSVSVSNTALTKVNTIIALAHRKAPKSEPLYCGVLCF